MDHQVARAQAPLSLTAAWRKSSYSNPSGNCVETAGLAAGIAVRDSRSPGGPALTFSPAAWTAFTGSLKN